MSVRRLTHLGICVADLERSLAFYRDALGFVEIGRFRDDQGYSSQLLELDDVRMEAIYLERDGWRIELLCFAQPRAVGSGARRPINELGLTHLSFVVENLEESLTAVLRHGGAVIEQTRMEMRAKAIFATDPDGTRLELIERAGDPLVIPGQKS